EERKKERTSPKMPKKRSRLRREMGWGYHALFETKKDERKTKCEDGYVGREGGWMDMRICECVPLEQSSFFLQLFSCPKMRAFLGVRWGGGEERCRASISFILCFFLSFTEVSVIDYTPCVMYTIQLRRRILHQGT
ncbi:hypothetical protein COCMIDRAFT_98227, partial [Bipolaris oryzae ATCC 44560]